MLAIAEPDLLRLGQGELLRAEAAAFVAAIAARLMTTQAAGTPPVVSSGQFNGDGLLVVDFGEVFHGAEFGRAVEKINFQIEERTSRTKPGPR